MPSQDKKMLKPSIDQLTRSFFAVETYDMTPEQCETAIRGHKGHPITTLVNKRKGIMRQVRGQLNTVAGINIHNASVNKLLSYMEQVKHNNRSRYCETSLTERPDKYVTGTKFKESMMDAIAVMLATLLKQRTEYRSEKGRPLVAVVACDPFVNHILQERMQFDTICGFRIHLVSTLNIAFRDRVIVSLCSPSYPAGKLRVANTPIRYAEEMHGVSVHSRPTSPGKPEDKHPFHKPEEVAAIPVHIWDTAFTGSIIYEHVMNDVSMGVINFIIK